MYDSGIINRILLAIEDFTAAEEVGLNDDLERDLSIDAESKKSLAQFLEKKFKVGRIYNVSFEEWKSVKDVVYCVYGYVCDRVVTFD